VFRDAGIPQSRAERERSEDLICSSVAELVGTVSLIQLVTVNVVANKDRVRIELYIFFIFTFSLLLIV
jgi:hypothetical protein